MDYIKCYAYQDLNKLKTITDFLESKEQYILQKYKYRSDFGTSLQEKHVSTRSGGYSVFEFREECTELNDLLDFLTTSYWNYMDNVLPKDAYTGKLNPAINCWVNILRDGENIGRHKHSQDHTPWWSFISASMVLRAKNTCTRYMYKDETLSIDNAIGNLTIFPPHIDHWTDTHRDTQNRVTLGMDFFFDKNHSKGSGDFHDSIVILSKL